MAVMGIRPRRVLDDIPVEVRHRPARLDDRVDVLGAVEAIEARVAARLVGQEVGLAAIRRGTDGRALRAVDADPDEVGERLARVRPDGYVRTRAEMNRM
jgi:hypothetical protein